LVHSDGGHQVQGNDQVEGIFPAFLAESLARLRRVSYNVAQRWNMTANAVVRARIDEQIKNEATAVLAAVGLTVSDAFRLMLTRVARDKALPFEPLIPNDETIAAMREARQGKLKSFDTIEALMADLNADH
jgi:DNA-damage-inducible protein J